MQENVVAYEQKDNVKLAKKILLSDVLTDLPVVSLFLCFILTKHSWVVPDLLMLWF